MRHYQAWSISFRMMMEGSKTTRKSCDFCYRRKMRCDGQKPHCSHCTAYEVECTYSAPSRKSVPRNRRNYSSSDNGIDNTQNRLKRLEDLVKQVTERLQAAERGKQARNPNQREYVPETIPSMSSVRECENSASKSMTLPPLQQVLPIVQIYLDGFNSVLPLFHAETLLQLVHDWYCVKTVQQDPVAWAAINVVLALAQRHNTGADHEGPSSATYLNRVESVLPMVVLGDIQLLNVQVLVGMVTLLQNSQDLQPALILLATTMRLAHAIGLHDRIYSADLDTNHERQRAYVFWLAYILVKDLSMRSKQPSIQNDDDINLDLPLPTIMDYHEDRGKISIIGSGGGVISTMDGSLKMNYFTARIQLAAIEGGVYDYIFSTRARKRSPAERSHALKSVADALERWKASIPSVFKTSAGLKMISYHVLRFLGALHSTSLACATLINQAHAWDDEWVGSIRRYSRLGVGLLLPPKWEALVNEARYLLVLSEEIGTKNRQNWWAMGCP
ncbi:uncharacterized protein PV09_02508 [Verruconis gallopava]|uniref:Zn(2)-C6 fungal-type domain-containing protein n=1 Tax=Verruconis gallopava TaxID=253628 RepID=A0A0D2AIU0_9PEZI|nr:uncharacterized protein PV09_02508 [Verruconis gallopava]KIW06828.1 hypothetical protein PV09_02508 [Verruconis gallopava]